MNRLDEHDLDEHREMAGHEHGELVLPDPLVNSRAFGEIRESVSAAVRDDASIAARSEAIVQQLEREVQRLELLAALARELVFADQDALEMFSSELLLEPAPDRDDATPTMVDRGDQEPSFLSFDPVVDLHVGAAYAGLGDAKRAGELLANVGAAVDRTLPRIDFLHLQAQRFTAQTLTGDSFLQNLQTILRRKFRIRQFDTCAAALREVLGQPGSAVTKSIQTAQPDPNTSRIDSIDPSTVCAGNVITLKPKPSTPFDASPPAGIKAFFAACSQEGTIENWKPLEIRVTVPDSAQSGRVVLGRDRPSDEAAQIQEIAFTDAQAVVSSCQLIAAGGGSQLLKSFYVGLPMTVCKDAFAPPGVPFLTVRSKPRVDWFTALDERGEVIGSRAITPCAPVTLQWSTQSHAAGTAVVLEIDGAQVPGTLPLVGTLQTEARPRYRLLITDGCGTDSRALNLNLGQPELNASVEHVMLRRGQSATVTISSSCPVASDTTVTLTNSDPARVSAPASATIRAGSREVAISVTAVAPGRPLQAAAVIGLTAPGHVSGAVQVWVENTLGEWQRLRPEFDLDMVAIHAVLLASGEVLFFAGDETDYNNMAKAETRRWDPISARFETPSFPNPRNLFCGGQCVLPDGRVLAAGGHAFQFPDFNQPGDIRHQGCDRDIHVYSRATDSWSRFPSMLTSRWYPTCVLLPNGRVLIVSGYMTGVPPNPAASPIPLVNPSFDLFDPTTGTLNTAQNRPFLSPVSDNLDLYPFLKVLPGGALFVHTRDRSRLFFADSTPAGGALGVTLSPEVYLQVSKNARTYPAQGACVLLPLEPGQLTLRILTVGGAGENDTRVSPFLDATDTAEIFDFIPALGSTQRQFGWRSIGRMARRRFMSDAVLLADGQILVAGGAGRGKCDVNDIPVLQSELFDPVSEQFRPAAAQSVERRYHGVTLLLPDGRVVAAGGTIGWPQPPLTFPNTPYQPVHALEIYFPPYLYRGPRPQITSAPSRVTYGERFGIEVDRAQDIKSVAFIRPGAVTHTNDMDQRYVRLEIQGRADNRLFLVAPPDTTWAPPGYYMVVVVTRNDIPSVAKFVAVR